MKKILLIIIVAIIIITSGTFFIKEFLNNDKEISETIKGTEEVVLEDEVMEEVVGINIGNIAPNFTLENIYGEEESLESYRGKNILLTFFSTT